MKVKYVSFERTKSLPGFNNKKVGIQIELEEGDTADRAIKTAKIFVAKELGEAPSGEQMKMALEIVEQGKEFNDLPF